MDNEINKIMKELEKMTATISECRKNLHNRTETKISCDITLNIARNKFIIEGVDGKNEKEREANLFALTIDQVEALEKAEQSLRQAKMEYDVATIACDGVKLALRTYELGTKDGS